MTDDPKAPRPRRSTRRTKGPSKPLPPPVEAPWLEVDAPVAGSEGAGSGTLFDGVGLEPAASADEAPPADATPAEPIEDVSRHSAPDPGSPVCPFLRAVGPGGAIGFPIDVPDVANRCAALQEAVPQSLRQQELVCLTNAHVNCPRYLRGAVDTTTAPVPRPRVQGRTQITPAIAASLVILGLSFVASVVFGLANGGLQLPSPSDGFGSSASAADVEPSATVNPTPTIAPTEAPSPEPTPSVEPTSSVAPTASATATPTAGPTPTPTAAPTTTPKPSSDRYDLLTPCADKPDCYVYRIRSGDNLFSIAKYFGVPLQTVKQLNPWTRTERLKVGRALILPPPTR